MRRCRRVVSAKPVPHWRRIRTANGLDRLIQEMKRCGQVVKNFPNRERA